jgi:TusA-related sulfurtransferase
MDEQWRPEKTTTATAMVTVTDSIVSGEVLEAMETEDGVTKDIKRTAVKQTKKQMEQANKETAARKGQKRTENSYEWRYYYAGN